MHTIQELEAMRYAWRKNQVWMAKPPNSDWHVLPTGYQPGWFFDTEYKMVS